MIPHEGDSDMTASKHHGTALVTGASSGIGAIYADRLARRGYDLTLVARNRERLEALAQPLARETGRTVDLVVADLNDRQDIRRVEAVLRSDATITLLVNNAGVVDEQGDGRVRAEHRLDTPDILAVVEIGHDEIDRAARLAGEGLRQRLEALAVARDQEEIIAAAREAVGVEGPYARRGAGHERRTMVLGSSHIAFSFMRNHLYCRRPVTPGAFARTIPLLTH